MGSMAVWIVGSAAALIWSVLNSNFWTSLAGAGAGAIAGAWAAQEIADRRATSKRQIEEARSTNAAVAATIAVINTYAALKRQHVAPTKQAYDRAAKKMHDLHNRHAQGMVPPGTTVRFSADLKTLTPPHTPIDILGNLLSEKIDARTQLSAIYYLLAQAATHLAETLEQRNELITWMQNDGPTTDQGKAEVYFGLRQSTGRIDSRYPDLMTAMELQTNDCIVFGKALAEDLAKHSHVLAQNKVKGMPKAATCNMEELSEMGLLPDMAEYRELLARTRGEKIGQ